VKTPSREEGLSRSAYKLRARVEQTIGKLKRFKLVPMRSSALSLEASDVSNRANR
jgi:hypothetical protein